MRHTRQEGHHHAQGHPARQEDPWRESLNHLQVFLKTIGLFKDHKFQTKRVDVSFFRMTMIRLYIQM